VLPNLTVPVLNRYDLLQRMLDSIDYPIRDLLIIDNGPGVDALHFPDYVLRSHYLQTPANLGVAGSWNLGIKSFPHDDAFFFASNDVVFEPGALERLQDARSDEITLSEDFPHWQVFSFGYEAVRRLGLFDECGFFPAYFEDNDMTRRAEHHGVNIRRIPIPTRHDNSSTLQSDEMFRQRNSQTFVSNQDYFDSKMAAQDFTPGVYQIERRRQNAWDLPPVE
jgi:GT2 family glycosyltransferase